MLCLLVASLVSSPSHSVDPWVERSIRLPELRVERCAKVANLGLGTLKTKNGTRVLVLRDGVSLDAAVRRLQGAGIGKVEPEAPRMVGNVGAWGKVSSLQRLVEEQEEALEAFNRFKAKRGEEEEGGLDYLGALLHYRMQRAYPNDTVDWSAWDKASAHRDQMPPARIGPVGPDDSPAGTWTFVGPKNLDTPYRTYWGLPPVSGRVNAIAVHPTVPTTLYIGGAGGGLLRSTNGGTDWTSLSDSWETLQVSCITLDPTDPNKIYVGTGDYHGWGSYGVGIMKSVDGGATWTNIGRSQMGNFAVSDIVVDPENPNIVVASAGRGRDYWGYVYRSTNGGATWTATLATYAGWSDLALSAKTGTTRYLYAGGGDYNGGQFFRSADRGATWTSIRANLGPSANFHDCYAIACSPTDPEKVYAMLPTDNVVKKSTDHGQTWTTITGNLPTGYNWTQGWYDFHLTCSTKTGGVDVLYCGLIDVQVDDGADGTWASVGGPTFVGTALLHNDQHSMAIDPSNPNVAYVGNDGGFYKVVYNPTNQTFAYTYLSANIGVTQFYSLATHPTDATRMLGGTQDNATPWSRGTLGAWDNVAGGDGVGVTLIKNAPNTMYASYQYYGSPNLTLYKTTNGWSSSTTTQTTSNNEGALFIGPMASDATGNVYIGTTYLYRYTGSAWNNRLGNQVLSATGKVSAIHVAPSQASRLYSGASDGDVYTSGNSGANWTRIDNTTNALPDRYVTSISADPANPADVLVGLSGTGSAHLYRCSNTLAGSPSWVSVSGTGLTGLPDIPLNGIARDPDDPAGTWYVATDIGVFMTTNAGSTWSNATGPLGLPNVQCNAITAEAGTRFLTVATFGRGAWRIALPAIVCPTAAVLALGEANSGDVGALCTSDDVYLDFFNDPATLNAALELTGTSPITAPSALAMNVELSVARQGLAWGVDFYNYSTSAWTFVNGGVAPLVDASVLASLTGTMTPYVQTGTKQVRARVRFNPINDESPAVDGWLHRLDLARWTITP